MTSEQNKIYLEVPFKEKDEAKELGAWWDPERKKWYVPQQKAVQPFRKWLTQETNESDFAD